MPDSKVASHKRQNTGFRSANHVEADFFSFGRETVSPAGGVAEAAAFRPVWSGIERFLFVLNHISAVFQGDLVERRLALRICRDSVTFLTKLAELRFLGKFLGDVAVWCFSFFPE